MSQISIKELDEFSIHGNLYEHRDPSNRGIVLGTGILGNRFGLKDAAKTLAEQLHDYVITLDPPSHHRNLKQEFSFGNYAKDEENAASYLRDRYKVECVIGGGHSGGAMAGLFAVTAYSDLEQSLLESNRMPIVPPYRKVFDGLIVAALPADARTAAPGFMYAPFVLKIAQYLFHKDNKTKTENFTKYVKKSKDTVEWKHFATKDIKGLKRYMQRMLNPREYVKRLEWEAGAAQEYLTHLRALPKVTLIGGRDMLSFGLKTIIMEASEKELEEYHEQMKIFGIDDKHYHVFPASHLLNKVGEAELDSLWGLQAPEVQNKIIDFIKTNF